jgi:hypothetical protein
LKNRDFLLSATGTESALRVGFGDGFGVKLAVLCAGESSLPGSFLRQQALQIAKENEPGRVRSY